MCNLVTSHFQIRDKSLIWNSDLTEALELQNSYPVSMMTIVGAENRRESRGAHFRDDYKVMMIKFCLLY